MTTFSSQIQKLIHCLVQICDIRYAVSSNAGFKEKMMDIKKIKISSPKPKVRVKVKTTADSGDDEELPPEEAKY